MNANESTLNKYLAIQGQNDLLPRGQSPLGESPRGNNAKNNAN